VYNLYIILFEEIAMSDTVQITLIVAVVVLIVLFMFRERLRNFMIKASREGVEANLDTNQPANDAPKDRQGRVNITGNKLMGNKNRIDVGRSNVNVEKNLQKGSNQEIVVRTPKSVSRGKSKPSPKKKR